MSVCALKGPVVLLGPPGVGKSTAGRAAADRLGMRFVDLDAAIARGAAATPGGLSREERSVAAATARIFREEGEVSFRARELRALDAALDGSDVVIAAGAGVVDTAPGRALLAERALCVGLDVDAAVALERLSSSPRPWLPAGDRARARAVYEAREAPRRAARASLRASSGSGFVDGDGDRDHVAAALAAVVAGLRPVRCASLEPEVVVADGAALAPGALLPAGAVVVVEDVVAKLHPFHADLVFTGGEGAKTLAHVERIAHALLERGISRDAVIVAAGGGAFLDAVGLASSLVLRGVRWWAVPTTLLAMADAGVGGKTAVNALGRKNQLGAFHPPERTVVDVRFLETLGEDAMRAGRAEMLKHDLLAADAPADGRAPPAEGALAAAVARSLSLKLGVARKDPRERGLRAVLNLGHTVAHALEAVTGIGHGDAVRYGLAAMLRLSAAHAGLDAAAAAAMRARLGPLPPLLVDVERALAALAADKKGGRFVLLRAPGLPVSATPPRDDVVDAVRAITRG